MKDGLPVEEAKKIRAILATILPYFDVQSISVPAQVNKYEEAQ